MEELVKYANDPRVEEILQALVRFAKQDFHVSLPLSGTGDEFEYRRRRNDCFWESVKRLQCQDQ
jgi:hypothetical protein